VLEAIKYGLTYVSAADGVYELRAVLTVMPPPLKDEQAGLLKHEQARINVSVQNGSPIINIAQGSPGNMQQAQASIDDGGAARPLRAPQRQTRSPAMPESLCFPPMTDEEKAALAQLPEGPREALRGVLDEIKVWPVGQPIEVSFMGGAQELRQFFVETARDWMEAANGGVVFDFGAAPGYRDHRPLRPAQIRIAFEPAGNWSYIGIDSALKNGASLNIGDAAGRDLKHLRKEALRGVILHELGHALGLQHEHQSPESSCAQEFDWEKVYASLGGPPNNWSKPQVDHNLRPLMQEPRRRVTEYDPKSIMHYALPAHLFKAGVKSKCFIERNTVLSDGDRAIIRAAYPATPEKQQAYLADAGKRIGKRLEESGIGQEEAKELAELAAALVQQSYPGMGFKIDITNVRKDVRKQTKFTQIVKGDDNIAVGQATNSTININNK
jgi:hypothetical protein